MNYKNLRDLYYAGILVLVLYALPALPFITDYLYPILQFEIVPEFPVITAIAFVTGFGAFMAYKYRKIG